MGKDDKPIAEYETGAVIYVQDMTAGTPANTSGAETAAIFRFLPRARSRLEMSYLDTNSSIFLMKFTLQAVQT